MSEVVEPEVSTELVLAHSGELVDLTDERQIVTVYGEVKELKDQLAEADRRLRAAIAEVAKLRGTKTFYVDGVGKVEVRNSERVEYLADVIEEGLRALGCPEETIREIVVETVVYKVDGNRARRAASANPEYAAVIERARVTRETLPSVQIT